ncbi:MAG TPA: hypothetical protein VFO31_13755 [Vicinamibacterales bacterium]|nr:hypothetical protein [Vicinamibacterales bacterium]
MRAFAAAWIVACVVTLTAPPVAAQKAVPPARQPTSAVPPGAAPSGGLVIAPSKPVVAPGITPRGDSGATPGAARSANGRTVSVSARQAAEQTIAALVAAMKNLPKRPPAPPESRSPRARRGEGATAAQAFDTPPPIVYKVTWPATPPELGLDRRVELDWTRESAGAARLRWNETTPD